jgi:hypothetical protein
MSIPASTPAPGRNDPCPCGSGKKWKKCHGDVASSRGEASPLDAERSLAQFADVMRARQRQREQQQGLGIPITSAEFRGYRFVAVGNQVLWSRSWRTFHDFLFEYLPRVLGKEWGTVELKKPAPSQHPLFRLHAAVNRLRQGHTVSTQAIQTAVMTGAAAAYLGLAYHLYLLAHNAAVQDLLVKRLRNADQFWPAFYETSVAAHLIQAGFELTLEDETDSRGTHCEFIARHRASGRFFAVEAKHRRPNKQTAGVSNQLHEALKKANHHARIVFIDVNVDARGEGSTDPFAALPWLKGALSSIRGREESMTVAGKPAPPAYVVVTSEPYEAFLDEPFVGLAFAAEGFKIPDFKIDSAMTLREARLARTSHREVYDLLQSMLRHRDIPITFDGEIPEFAFGESGAPRLIVGQSYLIPGPDEKEVVGVLESAMVTPQDAKALGVYQLADGQRVIASCPLTQAEVAAYRRHPDTFFGTYAPTSRQARDPLDLYDFFIEAYGKSSRDILLGLMANHPDVESLSHLPQDDLAIIYCERMTEAATRQP